MDSDIRYYGWIGGVYCSMGVLGRVSGGLVARVESLLLKQEEEKLVDDIQVLSGEHRDIRRIVGFGWDSW